MIIPPLALLLAPDEISASRFFPLVAGNHWVYEDTAAPGSTFESTVKPEVKPLERPKDERGLDDSALIDQDVPYFPLEQRMDGRLTQTLCYHEKDMTLFHVGNGPNKPVSPRAVMVVSKQPVNWDFYGDNVSVYAPEPIHYTAHSEMGPEVEVLGKKHMTVVVTLIETFGPKDVGVNIKQTWKYAADVGLYELTEDGKVGKQPVHHVRKLVKFEPGEVK